MSTGAEVPYVEPNLGEILQELSKSGRQKLMTKINTNSSTSMLEFSVTQDQNDTDKSVVMYERTRFTNAEIVQLMVALAPTVANEEQEKPEIDFEKFGLIMKDVGFSQFFVADKVFKALDEDRDEKISIPELILGLSILLRGSLEEQIVFGFKVYDTSRRGFLTLKDVTTCIEDSLNTVESVSSSWKPKPDENANELVSLIFPKLDRDEDGAVSFSDFRSACVNDPTLLESLGSWLPKQGECHNAHRVSKDPVSNLSIREEYLRRTSMMSQPQLYVPSNKKNWRLREPLKPIEVKARK